MTRHEDEESRKQQILEAAASCLKKKGYHKTTMDDIASEAGLSKGALYWYFKSKDEVLVTLCKTICNGHLKVLEYFSQQKTSIKDLILSTGEKMLEISRDDPDNFKIHVELWSLMDENKNVRKLLLEDDEMWRDTISNLLNTGIKNGEIKPGIKVRELATAIVAIYEGIIIRNVINSKVDLKKTWQAAISALFEGIAKK